jgi:AraC-like DNA-binding protein
LIIKKTFDYQTPDATIIVMEGRADLLKAHSLTAEFLNDRFLLYATDTFSVATLIRSPDFVLPPLSHSHEEYEFIIPLTPIPYLTNEDAVYFGEVGCVYPVHSGRSHGMKYELRNVSHDDIVIQKEYFEGFLAEKGLIGVEFNSITRASRELMFYLSIFKAECEKEERRDERKLDRLSALICGELIDLAVESGGDDRHHSGYQRGVRSAAEYMNLNYKRPLTLTELAAMCGLSDNYFSHCFKLVLGDTPFQYLAKLRISIAGNLLVTTALSIGEVARESGFRTVSAFSCAFKKETGKSPSEFREELMSI